MAVRAVFPSRGCQSLSHERCGGFCLHTHQQEFCLSPFPEFFMHIKSSFSCAFVSSLYCSPPSLGCSFCNRLQEEISRETYFTCPEVAFPKCRALLEHLFSPLLFFSLDFLFQVEEKLYEGQFSSFIYCNVVCVLGGVLPLTELVVFSDSPCFSMCGKWQPRRRISVTWKSQIGCHTSPSLTLQMLIIFG